MLSFIVYPTRISMKKAGRWCLEWLLTFFVFVFAHFKNTHETNLFFFVSRKKRSIPVTLSERQKPPNSYARIFAAQKQKKAKENETKIVKNGDSKQRVEPEEHVNGHKHHSDHFGPWRPVDSGVPASYDSTLGNILMQISYMSCLLVFLRCYFWLGIIYFLLERANAVMFTLKNTPMGFFYVNYVKRKFLLFVAENVKIE